MVKVPSTIGACIDLMKRLEVEAQGYEVKAKALWADYQVIEDALLERFKLQELDGASGKLGRIEIHNDPIKDAFPQVEDWDKFYAYMTKHKAFELLQKRVGVNAWRERLEQKIIVPGTAVFHKVTLKLLAKRKR